MSALLKDIGSALISSLLCEYINNVDPDQLSIALSKGELSLTDVKVRENALSDHQLPFRVVTSNIGSIQITIPLRYTTAPATIEISDIDVLLNASGSVIIESDLTSTGNARPSEQKESGGPGLLGKMMYGVIEQIVANLRFKISNVHIRVEHNKGKTIAGGLFIREICCFTVDEQLEPVMVSTTPDVLWKQLQIMGLSIYMDSDTELVDVGQFSESMRRVVSAKHEYVLHDFGVTGILRHPKVASDGIANEVTVKTDKLEFVVSRRQYVAYESLQREIRMFGIRRFYAKSGLPDRMPHSARSSGLWWRYAANCARVKRNSKVFKIDVALQFLKNKDAYRDLFIASFDDPSDQKVMQKLNELEDSLDSEAYLRLEYYAKSIWRKSKSYTPELSQEDIEMVENARKFETSGLKISYIIQQFGIVLDSENVKMGEMALKRMEGLYTKVGPQYHMSCDISEIFVADRVGSLVFELLESGDKKGSSLVLTKDSSTQASAATFSANAPNILYSIPFLDDMSAFFAKTITYDSNIDVPVETAARTTELGKLEMIKVVETHRTMELDVHLDAPLVTIPTAIPIYFVLGSVDIKSIEPTEDRDVNNPSTFYDQFSIDITGLEIKMADKYVCKPVATKVRWWQSFIPTGSQPNSKASVEIDAIELLVNRVQYVTFLTLMDMLGTNKEPQTTSVASNPEQQQLQAGSSIDFSMVFHKVEMTILDLDDKMYSSFLLDQIQLHYLSLGGGQKAGFHIRDFKAFTSRQLPLFSFGERSSGNVMDIDVNIYQKTTDFRFRMTPCSLLLDMNTINNTMWFFQAPSKRRRQELESSEQLMQMATAEKKEEPDDEDKLVLFKFASRSKLNMDIECESPQVMIPITRDTCVRLGTRIISVASLSQPERSLEDPETFYDGYSVKMESVALYLGEEELVHPVSVSLLYYQSFIHRKALVKSKIYVSIPEFIVDMSRDHYLNLCSLLDFIKSAQRNETLLSASCEEDVAEPVAAAPPSQSQLINISLDKIGLTFLGTGRDHSSDSSIVLTKIEVEQTEMQDAKNMKLSLKELAVMKGEKSKLHIGDDTSPAMTVVQALNSDDKEEFAINLSKPIFDISFEWIWKIKEFIHRTTEEKPATRNDSEKQPSDTIYSFTISDPSIAVGFKGIDHRHFLTITTDTIGVSVISGVMKMSLSSGRVAVDDRKVTTDTDVVVRYEDGVIYADVDVLDLNLESKDYRFVMDALGYFRVFIPRDPCPGVLPPEGYKWNKIINIKKVKAKLNEDNVVHLTGTLSDIEVKMNEMEVRVTNKGLYIDEVMAMEQDHRMLIDSDGFTAHVYESSKVIFLNANSKFHLKAVPVNWIFNLVIYPTGIKEAMLRYPHEKSNSDTITVEFGLCDFFLLPTGKDFGVLRSDKLLFQFEQEFPNTTITLTFERPVSTCNHMGVFHDFLECDRAKMTIELPRISLNFENTKIAFQYQLFMETFHYLIGLISVGPTRIGGPFTLPPYYYEIRFDRLDALVIPRKMDNPDFCLRFDLNQLKIDTGEIPECMIITSNHGHVSTPSGKDVADIDGFRTDLRFELLDESILSEEDRESPSLCIHKFVTCVHMERCRYTYLRRTMALFLTIFQSFFAEHLIIPDEPDPFEVLYDTFIEIDKFDMTWYDCAEVYICNISAEDFDYHVFNQHDISIKQVVLDKNGYVFVTSTKGCDKSLTFVMNQDAMKVVLNEVALEIEYETLGRLTTAVMISPILSFRVRPLDPEPEPNPNWVSSYTLDHSSFIFPVDPTRRSDVMIAVFDKFVWSMQSDTRYEIQNLRTMFASSKDAEPWPSFLQIAVAEYHSAFEPKGRVYIVRTAPFHMSLGAIDITSILMIGDGIDRMKREFCWESTPDTREFDHNRIILNFGPFTFSLSRANRYGATQMTLLRFKFDPASTFLYEINTANLEPPELRLRLSEVLYMNPNTGLSDEIAESVDLILQVVFTETGTKIKFEFLQDLNMNVSFDALNQILAFVNDVGTRISEKNIEMPPKPTFSIVNQTGVEGWFTIVDSSHLLRKTEELNLDINEAPDGRILYHSIKHNHDPLVVYADNLQYATFINRAIVVSAKRSMKGQTIKFSSLLKFKNNLAKTMYLLAMQETKKYRIITEIPAGSSQGFPTSEPLNSKLALTDDPDTLTIKHRKFTIKEIKKECRIVRCHVKQAKREILLKPKVNNSTFVLTVSIEAMVVAINRLPVDVFLTLGDKPKKLPVDVPVSLPKINYSKPFKGTVSRGSAWGNLVMISTGVDDTTEIPIGAEGKLSIAVDAAKQEDSPQIQLVFYAPLIVFNRSSQVLAIANDPGGSKTEQLIRQGFEKRTDEGSSEQDGVLLWGTKSYFKKTESLKSMIVRIAVPIDPESAVLTDYGPETWLYSDAIDTMSLDTDTTLKIQNYAMNDTFVTLHYNLQSAQPYAKSRVLTLFSQLCIWNKMPYRIFLQPLNYKDKAPIAVGGRVQLEPGNKVPIMSTSAGGIFGFFTMKSPIPVPLGFTKQTHLTFISQDEGDLEFVELRIDQRGRDVVASFEPSRLPQPYMISNQLDVDIEYWQFGKVSPIKIPVAANSTTTVAYEDPNVLTSIAVGILDKTVNVDFQTDKVEIVNNRPVYVEVRASDYQGQTIIVSYDPPEKPQWPEFSAKMIIPNIHVSLIDGFTREFLLFSLRHIQLSYVSNNTLNTVKCFVHTLQLDDLHPMAAYPVAIVGASQGNSHFMEFRCSARSNAHFFTSIDDISIRLQSLYMFLDIRFISDLLNFITPQKIGTQKIIPPEPSDAKEAVSSDPVSVDRLSVAPTTFYISSRTSTGRPNSYPLFNRRMRYLPNITNFELLIPPYRSSPGDLTDINRNNLRYLIIEPYMTEIRQQMYNVFNSIDLLGVKKMVDVSPRRGVQRMVSLREINSLANSPVRMARAMPRRQIKRYDKFSGYVQMLIQRLDTSSSGRYASETIEILIDNRRISDTVVCITQRYIFEIQGSTDPKIVRPFFKIREVTPRISGDRVEIDTPQKSNPAFVIQCADERTAEEVAVYLSSRRFALSIGRT